MREQLFGEDSPGGHLVVADDAHDGDESVDAGIIGETNETETRFSRMTQLDDGDSLDSAGVDVKAPIVFQRENPSFIAECTAEHNFMWTGKRAGVVTLQAYIRKVRKLHGRWRTMFVLKVLLAPQLQ